MPSLALPIRLKVPVAVIGLGLLVAAVTLSMANLMVRDLAVAEAQAQVQRTASAQADGIQRWLADVEAEAAGLAANPAVAKAVAQLRSSIRELGDDALDQLRRVYIDENPHPDGERARLTRAEAKGGYHYRHEDLQKYFGAVTGKSGYDDILLISTAGDVLYSLAKEDEFATNLTSGPYKDSALATAFATAVTLAPGEMAISDYLAYAPAGGRPAMLLATPIQDSYGKAAGVLAIRLPTAHLDRIIDEGSAGIGDLAAYVIGPDGTVRAANAGSGLQPLALPALAPQLIASAEPQGSVFSDVPLQSGLTGFAATRAPDLPGGLEWVVVVERDASAALAGAAEFLHRSLILGTITLVVLATAGMLLARSISAPVGRLSKAMAGIGAGDLTTQVPGTARGDEVGTMARNLDGLRRKLAEADAQERRQQEARDAADVAVESLRLALQALSAGNLTQSLAAPFPEALDRLRQDFNQAIARVGEAMGDVIRASGSITRTAGTMGAAASDLSRRTETQASTLEETAAAIDELTASVRGTAEGAAHVERITHDARNEAGQSAEIVHSAVEAMTGIETSARHISQIIGVIDDIAFQTSLLALNAGVEAARAGDTGKGFAVVASEVRALAQRSSAAAKEIKALIATSGQQVEIGVARVAETGASLTRISRRVEEIATLVSGIARAAAEQSGGLAEINAGMVQLDSVTQQNAAMAAEAETASHAMAGSATHLQGLVGRFQTSGGLGAEVIPLAPTRPRPADPPAVGPALAVAGTTGRGTAAQWEDF